MAAPMQWCRLTSDQEVVGSTPGTGLFFLFQNNKTVFLNALLNFESNGGVKISIRCKSNRHHPSALLLTLPCQSLTEKTVQINETRFV